MHSPIPPENGTTQQYIRGSIQIGRKVKEFKPEEDPFSTVSWGAIYELAFDDIQEALK